MKKYTIKKNKKSVYYIKQDSLVVEIFTRNPDHKSQMY